MSKLVYSMDEYPEPTEGSSPQPDPKPPKPPKPPIYPRR